MNHTLPGKVAHSLMHNLQSPIHCQTVNQAGPMSDIFAFRDILSSSSDAFTDLPKLVDVVLTLPVTTASNERMFSTLDRVNNYLRNSCGNKRLSDLLVFSCLSEYACVIH